jgi:hypothetical protein
MESRSRTDPTTMRRRPAFARWLVLRAAFVACLWLPGCGEPPADVTLASDAPSVAPAAGALRQARITQITLEHGALSGRTRARLLASLIEALPASSFRSIAVPVDSSLNAMVNARYGWNAHQPQEERAVILAIARANRLPDPSKLRAGQTLLLPVLPVRPTTRGAVPGSEQRLDFTAGTGQTPAAYVVSGVDAVPVAVDPFESRTALGQAREWTLGLPDSVWRAAFCQLSADERLEVSAALLPEDIGATIEVFPVSEVEPAQNGLESAAITPDCDEPATLGPILAREPHRVRGDSGDLYVVDYFEGSRSHGDKVLDAVRSILEEEGEETLSNRVIPVEVDFRQVPDPDRKAELRLYAERIASTLPTRSQRVLAILDDVFKLEGGRSKESIPFVWLKALVSNRVDPYDRETILSMSLFARGAVLDGVLPPTLPHGCNCVVFAAGLNVSSAVAEDAQSEPLRTMVVAQGRRPYVTVGALVSQGKRFGMTSQPRNGLLPGMTSIEHGGPFVGRAVLSEKDSGTSFATARLAARLLIARTRHARAGRSLNGLDWLERLVLSSQPRADLVGQYVAPGPVIQKILDAPPGLVGVLTDGSIAPLQSAAIEVSFSQGGGRKSFALGRELGQVRALHVTDDSGVLRVEVGGMQWQYSRQTECSGSIRFSTGKSISFSSCRQLSGTLRGVIDL